MKRTFALMCLAAMFSGLGGCNVVGYVAHVTHGDDVDISVNAEYTGLENQTVAVLVNADMDILYRFPQAQLEISTAVSRELAGNVPGINILDPRQVLEFQTRNIYWITATYSQLARQLGVNRIVMIELQEYRLHEPGNTIMMRGVISGRVEVAEADSERPNDATYATLVTSAFPPNRPHGVPEADPLMIRKGVLDRFSRTVAWKFYDHTEKRSDATAR